MIHGAEIAPTEGEDQAMRTGLSMSMTDWLLLEYVFCTCEMTCACRWENRLWGSE